MKTSLDKRILVIDDEDDIRSLLNKYISRLGYEVDLAMDLTQAVLSINKELPDIILLDIVLPGCNGIEILKLIKHFSKDIIVIMMSGYEDENIAKESLKMGAFDYIKKPFDMDHIENILNMIKLKSL